MYTQKRLPSKPAVLAILIISLFLAACSQQIAGDDWPGVSTDGDIVYVANGPTVVAVDIEAERELWQYPAEPNASLLFFAAPLFENDTLYIGDYGASGGFFSAGVTVSLYALSNPESGAPTNKWVDSEAATDRIIAPPSYGGGNVYVGTADNSIIAFDAESGAFQWAFPTGQSIWASPVYDDGVLYVGSLDRSIYALDAATGDQLWQTTFVGAVPSSPVIANGLLFTGGFDNSLHALDAETGETVWRIDTDGWLWSSVIVDAGVVYVGDASGKVMAVAAEDGSEIWSNSVEGFIRATPVLENGMLYIAGAGTEKEAPGTIYAIDAADGAIRWQQSTPQSVYATPVVAAGTLVVAMQGGDATLLVMNLETGAIEWQYSQNEDG